MRTGNKHVLLALAVSLAGMASPAFAQATRTWISGVGDDANPCSRTAPCKTFAGAISKTAAGGEINTIDPGGFGAVTITKSITLRSDGVNAGILVLGTNGITINAGVNDKVILEGLDIEGLGNTSSGQTSPAGVSVIQAAEVTIRNSDIRNFQTGVNIATTAFTSSTIRFWAAPNRWISALVPSSGHSATM